MRVGIDATNIVSGGGLTHLRAFLEHARACDAYARVVVWASRSTLEKLPSPAGVLEYRSNDWLNGSLGKRILWTTFFLHREMHDLDVLFVPGGLYLGRFRPFVTMCRNMLPFTPSEVKRYGWSREGLRLRALFWLQRFTFRRASGVIFLSEYARREVVVHLGGRDLVQAVIPHGVAETFRRAPEKVQIHKSTRFLYVSTLAPYKNQRELVQAFSALRAQGHEVELDLAGDGPEHEKSALNRVISENQAHEFVRYHGRVEHALLPSLYQRCDAVIYASGCENFPNILIEAMASGKPVLSSDCGPMPEILQDSAIYFDPVSPQSIERAVLSFLGRTEEQRFHMAVHSFRLAGAFSWNRTFSKTAAFIANCAGSGDR